MNLIKALLTSPRKAFVYIDEHKISGWYAFGFISLFVSLFWFGYYSLVDAQWLRAQSILMMAGANPLPAELEQLEAMMPRETSAMRNAAIFSSVLFMFFQGLMLAAILNVATKIDKSNLDGYFDWLSTAWWSLLPIIPQLILALILMILFNDPQTHAQELMLTSLNQIVGLTPTDKYYSLFSSLDLFNVWAFLLLFYLLTVKTKMTVKQCLGVSATPFILELVVVFFLLSAG